MPAPVTPSDFKSVIPASNSSNCDRFRAVFVKLPQLLYKLALWAINDDGSPTADFLAWIGQSTGVLDAPTGVTASDGGAPTTILVTWSAVTGATKYDVWRSTSDDSGTATRVGVDIAVTSYTDPASQVTPNQIYFYFVRAKTDTGTISVFSSSDHGYAGTGGSGTTVTFNDSGTWTVPAGVTSISELKIYGGGAGGGGGLNIAFGQPGHSGGGGGGGAGGYLLVTSITVAPGDILTINAGAAGAGGGISGAGTAGGLTTVFKAGTTLLGSATGGSGGAAGSTLGATKGVGGSGNTPAGDGTAGTYSTPGVAGTGGTAASGGGNSGGAGGLGSTAGVSGGLGMVTIKIG